MNIEQFLPYVAFTVAVIGVLISFWDDIMIAIFQWSFGKLTEQQAWDMHYFHEEKSHFFNRLGVSDQYEIHKSRSIAHYRYAVRMHERNLRKAKHKD
ncbi:hypothetical protein ADP65_00007 [Achromobacter phage phiAxp-3]|uniref:Uncharacterized protein n=1 Tax=Achromobacter phage phiAxp-3 TaxID=1664247 RepID=A0A0K2FHN3_9CAUD|nr:hypothetical protein ADP65_00007 [Achromobacter phage phiAxp-3]ALA45476.1 hypothetical protein ADP65_00007 [Achromobacter phage phiAxp-3]